MTGGEGQPVMVVQERSWGSVGGGEGSGKNVSGCCLCRQMRPTREERGGSAWRQRNETAGSKRQALCIIVNLFQHVNGVCWGGGGSVSV